MSKGRRYEQEPKLNIKKVIAVIVAFIVVGMSIVVLSGIFKKDSTQSVIASKEYAAIFKSNKWGVIDSTGNEIIPPSYQEMIIIPNNKKDVFLFVYDVNYETGEYKTKALNSKSEELFTQYDQVEAISNQDKNNNLWYEEGVIKVKKDGKYGVINLDGKELIPCNYEEITVIPEIANTIKVKKDNKYGIFDSEGKEILPAQYVEVTNLGKDSKDGFIIQDENKKYGIVNYSNQVVLEAKYDEIAKIYGNDTYVVKQSGKQILVDKDGTQLLSSGFDEIKAIMKNKENGVIYTQNGKYGVMKLTGEVVISPTYEDLKEAKTGLLIAQKTGNYGIIDVQNQTKLDFSYLSISYNEKADIYIAETPEYSNNIIDSQFNIRQAGILTELNDTKGYFSLRQGEEDIYYNFKFEEKSIADIFPNNTLFKSKKDGKYGFVDKNGKLVIDYKYDDATEQNNLGYAAIKKDGKWGSIDINGNIVQEPTYNLDDYLKINFIGNWHLGKDLNMNYYNQL